MARGAFETLALQPQYTDIGSRGATLATTRHRLLAASLIPKGPFLAPCIDLHSLRDASPMRRSHPVHGGSPPSDPPAKTADSRDSFPNLE